MLVSLVLSVSALFAAPAAAPSTAAAVDWQAFGPGLESARRNGKPVLVQFFAPWCGYCRKMNATTFANASVVSDLKKAVTVKVDGDEAEERHGYRGTDLAEKYGVRVFPTHVLLDGEGRVVARAPGYLEPQQFLSWFKLSLAKAFQKSALIPPASGS